MKAHKFIKLGGDDKYHWVIVCEYCGHVAWHENRNNNDEGQRIAKLPCPLSPVKPEANP